MYRILALQKVALFSGELDFNSSNSNTCSSESTGGCHITVTDGF
jgi:hypothetical protein